MVDALYPNLIPLDRVMELSAGMALVTPLTEHNGISLDYGASFHLCPGGKHAGVDYRLMRDGEPFTSELLAVCGGWIEKQGALLDGTPFITQRIDTGYRDELVWAIYYHVREHTRGTGERVERGAVIGRVTPGNIGPLSDGGLHLHLQLNIEQKGWRWTFNPHLWGLPHVSRT